MYYGRKHVENDIFQKKVMYKFDQILSAWWRRAFKNKTDQLLWIHSHLKKKDEPQKHKK